MPDAAQLAVIEPMEGAVETKAALREIERKDFVETFKIIDQGKKYDVAANAIANRALAQINGAKLRALCERTIKPFMDDESLIPSPKDLKAIVDAVAIVEEMNAGAFSDSKKGGNLANSLERLAYAVTRGAVDGAAQKTGENHSPKARLNRMIRIGKATKAETIDVAPAK